MLPLKLKKFATSETLLQVLFVSKPFAWVGGHACLEGPREVFDAIN